MSKSAEYKRRHKWWADFNILAGNFGTAVTPNTNGDLTGDGLVNISDFNILAGDFGCGN